MILRIRLILEVVFLVIISTSCVRYYKQTNRCKKVTKSMYSNTDTIHFYNYVLCNNIRNMNKLLSPIGDVVPINEDSVLTILRQSLINLNLPYFFSPENQNYCDSDFHKNHHLKFKKIDHKKILEISSSKGGELVIVPIVYIDNLYENQIYLHSSGVPAGGDLVRNSYLKIGVYLLKNDEIIYFRSAKHFTISTHLDFEEKPKRQTQENWDKLVEMVMADYTQRSK
jgi:hypothetical protein